MTRIGVDVREWRSGTSTGIARLLSSFLEWATQNTEHEFLLFGNQHTEFRVTSARVDARVVHETSRLVWDQIALPRLLGETSAEVFLSPYYKGPLRSPCPVVVTANDLIELHFPRPGFIRRRLLPLWMRMMLRNASDVLTLSEYSRQDIVATLRVAASRITAVPLAVDDRFLHRPSTEETRDVRERYGLPDRYVLYVGRCSPHKNVVTLVRAWSELPADLRRRYALVLAGGDASLFRGAADARGVDAIIPGFVQDADLPGLYGGATIMTFPSLYEGFGLPPLEAMSSGTPVIVSNATSIPEVVGNAAKLVDPLDTHAWAKALVDLLENDEALRRLTAAYGQEHCQWLPGRSDDHQTRDRRLLDRQDDLDLRRQPGLDGGLPCHSASHAGRGHASTLGRAGRTATSRTRPAGEPTSLDWRSTRHGPHARHGAGRGSSDPDTEPRPREAAARSHEERGPASGSRWFSRQRSPPRPVDAHYRDRVGSRSRSATTSL